MTISSTTRKAGPFIGNGVTTAFPFDFKLFSTSDLRVVRAGALGVETDLVHVTDCTVTLNADQDENPGGSVVLNAPLADGFRLVLLSAVPELQPVDLTNQGGFYPELVNGGLDRNTVLVQQLLERMGRSITVPVTSDPGDLALPSPAPGQLIGWTGDGLTNFDPSELVSVVAFGSTRVDKFDGDGVESIFLLSASPGVQNNLRVSVGGVTQVPGEDFTWGGGAMLAFAAAPPAGTRIVVQYQEALVEFGSAAADLSNVGEGIMPAKAMLLPGLPVPRALGELLLASGVPVELFGATGDGTTDDSAAIQAAIDYVAALPGNLAGGVVLFGSGVYRASNLVLKARARLRGLGYGLTQIRRIDAGTGVLLFVPKSFTLGGWDNICFDGNNALAPLSSHIIEFETTNNSSGQSFSPAGDKLSQTEFSYKMASCWSFVAINGRVDGVRINGYNFDVRFLDFRISHCLGHGLYAGGTDSLFADGYVEKCGLSGVHVVSGANKFVNIKSIFNCRQDATPGSYANVWVGALGATPTTGIEMAAVEAQDGYGDGFFINAQDSLFSINSNTNGYKAFTMEDQSSRVHTNLRIGSSARRNHIEAVSHSYKTAVGTDGFWTTEWPYVIDTAATFTQFKCDYDPAKFNQSPAEARDILSNGNLGDLLFRAQATNATYADISPKTLNGTGAATIRLFRSTQSGLSTARVDIHVPGTATVKHRFGGDATAPTQFNLDDGGNVSVGSTANGGKWNTSHYQNGPHHIWTDASGRTRTKASAPSSDTDGSVFQYANSGATGSRPATPPVGWNYFDTTLGKPIWFKSPGWVDATGVAA